MPHRAGVFRRVGNRAGVSGRSESSRRQRRRTRALASAGRAAGESRSCAGADAHRHQPRHRCRGGRAYQLFASQHTAHGLSRAVYSDADHAGAGRVDSEAADAHESAPVRAVRRAAVALPRDDSRAAALRGDSAQQIAAAPRGSAGRRRERLPEPRRFGALDAAAAERRVANRRSTPSCPPSS